MSEAPSEPRPDEPPAAEPPVVPAPAAPAWVPPPTLADRASPWLRRALALVVASVALVLVSATLLWAIPGALASRHPGFQEARRQATSDRSLRLLLGRTLRADRWPGAYEIRAEGRSTFGFGVEGDLGTVWCVVEVEGDRVRSVRRHPNRSWQQRWMLRRAPGQR